MTAVHRLLICTAASCVRSAQVRTSAMSFLCLSSPAQNKYEPNNGLHIFCAGTMLEQGLLPGVSAVEFSADGSALLATHPDGLGRPHVVRKKEEWEDRLGNDISA